MSYGICPDCDFPCFEDTDDEPNRVRVFNRHKTDTDYGPGENWDEEWKCPRCGCIFIEGNGYP